jgi:Protein of unknown function (DUF2752)
MLERWVGAPLKAGLLPLVLAYWLLPPGARALLDVPCLFTAAFGVHCPGCGMKTAIIQLLGLDWRAAVATNPLAPGALVAVAWVSLEQLKHYLSKGGVKRDRVFHHRAADDDERAFA